MCPRTPPPTSQEWTQGTLRQWRLGRAIRADFRAIPTDIATLHARVLVAPHGLGATTAGERIPDMLCAATCAIAGSVCPAVALDETEQRDPWRKDTRRSMLIRPR